MEQQPSDRPARLEPVEHSIRVLAKGDPVEQFECEDPRYSAFLRNVASQNARRDLSVTHVACPTKPEPGGPTILGYYTLSSSALARDCVPGEKLPYPEIGITLIGMLAVDRRVKGQGFFGLLLADAIEKTLSISSIVATYGVLVEVELGLDELVKKYERRGFVIVSTTPRHTRLLLSLKKVRKARAAAEAAAALAAAPPAGSGAK